MNWRRRSWRRFAGVFRNRQERDTEFAAELDSHLQFHVEENLRNGMTSQEARREALRKLGGIARTKEAYRDQLGLPILEALLADLHYGARVLAKSPGATVAVILALALGIGATTAMFTVVRSVLLKPLPFKDPARLIRLYEQSADDKTLYNYVAAGVFAEWKKQNQSFSDLAISSNGAQYNLSGTTGQLPEKVLATECSWELFPMLGVEPALGRAFTSEDDRPSANATVVLSWGLWKRRFAGQRSVLNQTIRLDAKPYTVIGVMPPSRPWTRVLTPRWSWCSRGWHWR